MSKGKPTKQECFLFRPWKSTTPREGAPNYMHEVGILCGYRWENQPWMYYLESFIRMHNETFNIWTHFIGAAVVLLASNVYQQEISPEDDKARSILQLFTLCCLITDLTSAVVHLLHSKSPVVHYTAVLCDYIGVSLFPFASSQIAMFVGTHKDVYKTLNLTFIPLTMMISFVNFVGLALAKLKFSGAALRIQRKLLQTGSCGLSFVLISILFVPRFWSCALEPRCEMVSLNHLLVNFLLLIMMAIMYSTLFPERLWPGKFDLIGHSHQMFHVISTIAQVLQMRSLVIDVTSGSHDISYSVSEPDMASLYCSLFFLLSIDLAALYLMLKKIILPKVLKQISPVQVSNSHQSKLKNH